MIISLLDNHFFLENILIKGTPTSVEKEESNLHIFKQLHNVFSPFILVLNDIQFHGASCPFAISIASAIIFLRFCTKQFIPDGMQQGLLDR